jgi:hypothetical protein
MHPIKSYWSKYPMTWDAIVNALPLSTIKKLSSREIVELVDAWQKNRQEGASSEVRDLADHHNCTVADLWTGAFTPGNNRYKVQEVNGRIMVGVDE